MSFAVSRRQFTALAGGTLASAAVPTRQAAAAVEFVFKVGTNMLESHPLNVYLLKAFDEIRTTSDGRLDFQLFANNQLGGDSDMLSQLRSGALECFLNAGGNVLSTLNSSVGPSPGLALLSRTTPRSGARWTGSSAGTSGARSIRLAS
jgi:TRAP-type transport system periplasmic protein